MLPHSYRAVDCLLPKEGFSLGQAEASGTVPRGTLCAALERVEKEFLVEALKSSRGTMAVAAASLGITERIMGLRVRKYRIQSRRFRGT